MKEKIIFWFRNKIVFYGMLCYEIKDMLLEYLKFLKF